MDNKTFKKMLLGMAMASPLALINSGNAHASSVKTNVETNWHANSLATVQQELRNQNINPDYKITNAKYIVQAGDTLSQIAAATHINMYHIAAVNHIQNLNLIYVGQVLILNQGNEVAHNVAGNGSTTAASIGNTYILRSASQQPALNYYGHTQAQGTTGTPNVQRTANVNSKGTPTAEKPAKTIIPSTPSANNNNQNVKPATPTGNTGSHAGNTTGSTVTGNTTPSVSGSVNTGSHVAGNTNTGSTATPNTQGSASQTGSSATQNNNSQKTPTVDSSSASQQTPTQSSNAQQPASSASHTTTPNASSNTQQPASSASSASQPTGSSQAQGSVNTGSSATPSNSQKTPTVDSSSASQSTTASGASSNTQQPAQSSSSQSSVSSSSQQTTTSSSSTQQPASSASSSSQSTASTNSSSQSSASQQAPAQSSNSQSSASSSSQSSASSSSQSSTSSSASSSSQKTVDGYTLDNMPLSVFNDKKNLNAINNTFSGDAIENYFNNHIGKGNMTWDEAQQAQQNGTITSAILSWNGQMLPTEIKGNTYGQAIQNSTTNVNWNNSLPLSYLRNNSQEAQINNKYGNISNETNESQSEGLTQYMLEVINNYRKSQGLSEATTDSALQQKAQERLNTLTSFSHSGMVTDDEALEEMEVTPNNEFDLMNQGYQSIVDMLLDDADSNWGHRNTLLHDKQFACAYKVVNGQGIIVIVANK
ncbi:LysM peptidoglycan-binding domain-containing protein [Ligilactobacillus aviarius]|uniref:LysM peptidoglycan-binding domain-containing protein n=1 Tax=Ligilactobacillus aviarius TaxID=1606 RepID=UPI0024B94919|nr:LysM peptidoglycan-binding domain-containing protein [Ligilactobacillus aviarius]